MTAARFKVDPTQIYNLSQIHLSHETIEYLVNYNLLGLQLDTDDSNSNVKDITVATTGKNKWK